MIGKKYLGIMSMINKEKFEINCNILGEHNDIWSINVEEDYHEESSTGRSAPEFKD